jgi:hypothetical protein
VVLVAPFDNATGDTAFARIGRVATAIIVDQIVRTGIIGLSMPCPCSHLHGIALTVHFLCRPPQCPTRSLAPGRAMWLLARSTNRGTASSSVRRSWILRAFEC